MQNAVIRTEKTWGVQSVGPRPGESHLQHGAPGLGPPLFCVAHGETGLSLSFRKPLVLLPSTQAAASLGQYGASRSHAYLPTFNGELGPQCHPCLTELRNKEWEIWLGPPSLGMSTGLRFRLPCWPSLPQLQSILHCGESLL